MTEIDAIQIELQLIVDAIVDAILSADDANAVRSSLGDAETLLHNVRMRVSHLACPAPTGGLKLRKSAKPRLKKR
jgi:hypothetical protein